MRRHRLALVRRVSGFVILPFISSLAPFILLPLLARRVSTAEWAGLGIGQAVGMIGAVAVTWGWQLLGPVLVAGVEPDRRRATYLDSLVIRGAVCLVVTPLLVLLSAALAPVDGQLLATTMTAAICVSGMTPTWYFIGLGKPAGIAVWDILPRVAATVLAAVLVILGVAAVCYPLALFLASLVAAVCFSVVELQGCHVRAHLRDASRYWAELKRGFNPMATEMTLSLYSSGSVAAVGWRATTETVAVYSSAFRLYRLAVYFVTAMANGLQGWVAEKQGAVRRRRTLVALQAHTLVGVVGGLVMALWLPEVSTLLFGPQLSVGHLASVYLGIAFLAASVGNSLGRHLLIPAGATSGVFWSTLWAAVVGLPLSVVLAAVWGSAGATAALAISQLVVILLVARRCLSVLSALGREEAPATAGHLPPKAVDIDD
jgi:O-antigen/teichoic acid export membrane protein